MRNIAFFIFLMGVYVNPVFGGQHFSCDDMDYFMPEGSCQAKQKQVLPSNKPEVPPQGDTNTTQDGGKNALGVTDEQVKLWGESTIDSDGKVVSKVPPGPVMKLLAEPTKENAKEYLKWHTTRMERIAQMQKLVESVANQDNIPNISAIKKVTFFFAPT